MLTLKLAWAGIKKSPSSSVMTFLGVVLSSTLLTVILCFCYSMISEMDPTSPDYTMQAMVFVSLAVAVAAVAIVLIRAVFAINFGEKVNLLGLLATVGMTNRNKMLLVSVSACFYALSGSFVGTAAGRFISAWHIRLMNDGMAEHYANRGYEQSEYFSFTAPFGLLAAAFAFSVLVTLIAASKPIKRISRLSVINSLKTDVSINISLREGIFEKIMCRFFGRIGRLAGQNYDNNSAKYRSVTMTLPCAQIVFVSIYSLFMWDYWEDDIYNAYGDPFFSSAIVIAFVLTAVVLLGAFGSMTVNINSRKREFAALKSMGLSNGDMLRLMCCESIFIMFYAVVLGLIGSYLSVWVQYILLWTSRVVQWFHFPWREWLVFVGIDIVFCLIFAVYATLKIYKINIASALK